ncbi:MAG: hypothetical protein QME85_06370 [Candidatus Saccharicenans sp.]|nr:hypothetical protein [Candidatus Saccharicenans sp.]MDI6850018.1 hypothetical protein [Candidatus Saccharicenans sp.]
MKAPNKNEKIKKRKYRGRKSKPDRRSGGQFFRSIAVLFLATALTAAEGSWFSPGSENQADQAQARYYNVDREIKVEGQIEDLKIEARYEGKGSFLVLLVRDKNSQELLEVETAPAWFFRSDIHKGEKIRLIGSLSEDQKDGKKVVVAREVRINNQTITLRDRRGFPSWSRSRGQKRGPF